MEHIKYSNNLKVTHFRVSFGVEYIKMAFAVIQYIYVYKICKINKAIFCYLALIYRFGIDCEGKCVRLKDLEMFSYILISDLINISGNTKRRESQGSFERFKAGFSIFPTFLKRC